MRRPRRGLALAFSVQALAVVAVTTWAALLSRGERPVVGLVLVWFALLILLALGTLTAKRLAVDGRLPRWVLLTLLSASLLGQVPLCLAPPALSDDCYRYLHEGRVLAAGRDPYRFAPGDHSLDDLAGPERARVGHQSVRAAYPPLAHLSFAFLAILGAGPVGLKLGMSLWSLALIALCYRLLPAGAQHRILLLAWHPLLLLEVAGSGHFDIMAVVLMMLALTALWPREVKPGRRRLAALALALGAWVKLLPAALGASLLRRLGPGLGLGVVLLGAAAVLPGLLSEGREGTQPGLVAYAEHWDFNGIVYPGLRRAIEEVELMEKLNRLMGQVAVWTGPQYTSRALLGLAWLACLAWGSWQGLRRPGEPLKAVFPCVAGFILFTPTLHPWYLTWLLPLVILRFHLAWFWLCGVVGLSYLSAVAAGEGPWRELGWVRLVEYGSFLLLWLACRRWGPCLQGREGAVST